MKRILLAAMAAATLAGPGLAAAQPYDGDRHDGRGDQHQDNRGDQRQDGRHDDRQDRRDGTPDRRDDRGGPGGRYDRGGPGRHDDRGGPGGWNHDAWRNSGPGWRGRPEWAGYSGRRDGYWYRPGVGYYRPDPRWYGHRWGRGEFVPGPYRSYYVEDPYAYGLRAAPYGYRWVYLDNNFALMALSSGLIADLVANAY